MNEVTVVTAQDAAGHATVDDLERRIKDIEAWGNATHKWLLTFKIEWAALSNQVRLLQKVADKGWAKGHIEQLNERIQAVEDRVRELEGVHTGTARYEADCVPAGVIDYTSDPATGGDMGPTTPRFLQ